MFGEDPCSETCKSYQVEMDDGNLWNYQQPCGSSTIKARRPFFAWSFVQNTSWVQKKCYVVITIKDQRTADRFNTKTPHGKGTTMGNQELPANTTNFSIFQPWTKKVPSTLRSQRLITKVLKKKKNYSCVVGYWKGHLPLLLWMVQPTTFC